jgi:DNA-binding transcriptional ArsR family regulator
MAPRSKRQQLKDGEVIDTRLAKALAHPIRIEILAEVSKGPLSPKEFTELKPKQRVISGVNYHFRRLEQLDCLEIVRETPRRGAMEHHYVAATRGFYEGINWEELPGSVGDSVNFTILRTLNDQVLEAIEARTFDSRDNNHFTWNAAKLDEQGWDTMMAKLRGVYAELADEEVAAAERMIESGEKPVHTTIALAGFESPPPKRKRI